jgi:uncharacterized phage protein (TIGR01671 family)
MKTRELKFRAWDNIKKEWLMGYKQVGGFSIFGECMAFGEWQIILSQMVLGKFGESGEDLVVQQFTGLLDKNGKEIYEGDILKYDLGETKGLINTVVWDHFSWRISEMDNSACFPLTSGLDYEIIGNIFETPELLKVYETE